MKSNKPKIKQANMGKFLKDCWMQRALILMVIPGFILVLVFNYFPMYGALIAFEKYSPRKGILHSEWVGLKYYKQFFSSYYAKRLFRNTFLLGFYSLIFSFPAPIIFALLLDQLRNPKFKKFVQTVSYFPHFLSAVVVVSLLHEFFMADGFINDIRQAMGKDIITYLVSPKWFRPLYIGSGIWQGVGWGSIIYLAALTNVDPQLNEAAIVDGANRFQRVLHVSIPCIRPTMTIMLIFAVGGILGNDFQKIILMYSEATYETADVISTYVYRQGIAGGKQEFATAVGLMMNVISCVLLVITNAISRKVSENSLW